MPSDIEIARAARLRPMPEVAASLGVPDEALIPYGRNKAKIDGGFIRSLEDRPEGKLILVTGDQSDARRRGQDHDHGRPRRRAEPDRQGAPPSACASPALGPCFGMKGGAAGGGYAQVVPMDEINLHFTGDFHAITAAHNLLAAMIDNHVYWGNALDHRPAPGRLAARRST